MPVTHLFTYGSLMCPDIFTVVSSLDPIKSESARLDGYLRCCIQNETYPAVVEDQAASVTGVLYRDVNAVAMQRLDDFEGEMYQRKKVIVYLNDAQQVEAQCYVLDPAYHYLIERREWDYQQFLKEGKQAFIDEYSGFNKLTD